MVDQVIKLKRNTTNTNAPGTSDIAVGELAIGAVAGKLYIRKSDDSILEFTDATASSSAADDISTGDAAVTIATTSGNITIDAQANDSDIIFKGTDGGSDTTFLTLDGSAAGAATFNDKIVATELDISGDVDIDGTLEADAVTVNGTALSSVIAGTTVTLASTATALATARTIGGVSFDGSANITPTTFAAATFSGDVNVDSGVLFADVSENRVGINQTSPDVSLDLGANTDSIHVPVGTTAQRPGSPAAGYFRYNSTTGKFEGYTDSWGSIGGGSGTNMDTNIFTGDGSDTTFTLSTAPDTENNLMVFVDGVFQAQNVYSVSGTTLTFATAPANGRVITVYHSTTTVGGSNNSIATMTGDGSDTTLTLSVAPVHENNVSVFFDGVYQSKANYSISGTTLTFSTAPANGVAVEAITATNTTSTTANQLLDADGDTLIQVEESSDEDKIRFDTGGTERMIIDDSGKVGIGTSSPDQTLQVAGNIRIPATGGKIAFGSAGATPGDYLMLQDVSSGTPALSFVQDSSTKFVIDGVTGRVGIGTSSPSQNLHIACDSGDEGILLKGTGNTSHALTMDANRSSAGGALGEIRGLWNGTEVARMVLRAGDDTSNKDDGAITFATQSDASSGMAERHRISNDGKASWAAGGIGSVATQARDFTFYTEGSTNGVAIHSNDERLIFMGAAASSGTGVDTGYFQIENGGVAKIAFNSNGSSFITGDTNSDTYEHLTLKSSVDNNPSRVNLFFESGQGKLTKLEGRQIAGGANAYGDMIFHTSNNGTLAEKARLMYDGVLAIGDSSPEHGDAETVKSLYLESAECVMAIKNTGANSSSQRQSIAFLNSSGTRVGTITTTSSSVVYNTSSDYRLKENVTDMTNATTRLKQLKPKRFNWIVDETNTLVDGFLAHEVQSVVPEAISGEKDGDEMQGIDQSKLIPLLVKTIQELEERIATLEG